VHPAAKLQFDRIVREYYQWRSVPEDERRPSHRFNSPSPWVLRHGERVRLQSTRRPGVGGRVRRSAGLYWRAGIFEQNLLPMINQLKLAARVIPIRSQYAVVLAFCGDFDAADMEMARLAPYEPGLDDRGKWELQNQRAAIARMRLVAPPPQWTPFAAQPAAHRGGEKIGVNAPCPCGSGKKYKKCHGRR
jgi:hypothetical protein